MTTNERPISEQDLHAYVDGLLDPARRARVDQYLASQPQVAERIAGWQNVNEKLRNAVAWKAEEPVPDTLNVARILNTRLSNRWAPWRVAAGILVALAIGSGSGWIAHRPSMVTGIASVAVEASMAQRVFGTDPVHPVEFGADEQPQFVKLAALRLGHAVVPPDLSEAGYRLLGGRIIATAYGPGCMFLYENGAGVRITLFARPMHGIDMNARMRPVQTDDTAGFVWSRNGVGYGLVSTNSTTTLHQLANKVRSAIASTDAI